MATEEYWRKQRERLLGSDHSRLRRLPMEPEALMAFGPSSALHDVLALLVLGLRDEARACLEFVPRLRALLSDPDAFAAKPQYVQRESAAYLRQALHLGMWLLDGAMDPALARDAYQHLLALNRWWGRRFTGFNLHHLMLLCIEGHDPETAAALYLEHERRPLALPPRDLRFTSSPRAVLFACLAGRDNTPAGMLEEAVERFRKRAARWEKSITPVPSIFPIDLARTLHACQLLQDRRPDLETILRLVE